MDFRGRGKSDNDPDYTNYTAGNYVKDAAWLLSSIGIEKVVAIGTSLGGIVTMVGAMTKPGLWAGAVINDIGPVIDPKGIARIGSYVGKTAPPETWDEAIAACKVSSGAAYPDFDEDDWLDFAHRAYSEDEDGNPTDGYDPNISKTFGGGGDGGDMWELYEALGDIPVLVIRGVLSDILSAETTEQMVDRLPNARAITIASQGHAPLLDQPDCLNAIKQLLEEIDK